MNAPRGSRAEASPDPLLRALAGAAVLLAAIGYFGWLGRIPLQRGNEAMYVTPSIHMLETGDYLVPVYKGEAFLDKPPMTFWLVAASYRLFGVSIVAARLPAAAACLATCVLLGIWVARRAGLERGLLAAATLAFSLEFALLGLSFAADALLALAVTAAVFALDEASRRDAGSDLAWGVLCGAALAFAFYVKGLLGVVIPAGAAAGALWIDGRRVAPLARRGVWAFATLGALIAPWHWAMTRRLGAMFWDSFYWRNQFLRGATPVYMQMHRGPLFYVGVLAWGIFPWSLLLPAALRRARPTSAPLAWFAFGFAFLSALAMKREVYLLPVYPAVAAIVAENGVGDRTASFWRRLPWMLAAGVTAVALVLFARGWRSAAASIGAAGAGLVGIALAALLVALVWAFRSGGAARAAMGTAVACGLLLCAVEFGDARLGRQDPIPEWGSRVRAECRSGCDGFVYGLDVTSLDFYSGFDWLTIDDLAAVPPKLTGRPAFLAIRTRDEKRLAALPVRIEVLDRRPLFAGPRLGAVIGREGGGLESASLLRVAAAR